MQKRKNVTQPGMKLQRPEKDHGNLTFEVSLKR